MAGSLSLTIGANTVTLPLKLTNAQLNAIAVRFATRRGVAVEGRSANEIGTDVLRELAKMMRDASIDQQRAELLAAEQATREATIAADNDLYDQPAPSAQAIR